ncbi:hypothetical protein SIID45300_01229 [Candidatus Magnetaquicoccaceae bacterium FCR-1]|uniref:Transglycosylase SLT domain-containing protein n=1 Tax=Candidatus Magnetaquiglobus chichijimensis TaxID=3141448 RepID=A0ABQ0C7Q2_9PROT
MLLRISLLMMSGVMLLASAVPARAADEASVELFRRHFAVLEQDGPLDTLLDRTTWPQNEFLASYLELEILMHPDLPAATGRLRDFLERWPNHPQVDRVVKLLEKRMLESGGEVAENWFMVHPGKSAPARLAQVGGLLRQGKGEDAFVVWRELYREGVDLLSKTPLDHPFWSRPQPADHEARARAQAGKDGAGLAITLSRLPEPRRQFFQALELARKGDGAFVQLLTGLELKPAESRELWRELFESVQKQGGVARMREMLEGREGARLADDDRRKFRYWLGRQLVHAKKEYAAALNVLEENVREKGGTLEDSAWLAGWSALKLGDPVRALGHFERQAAEGVTPEGRSQGGYWAARLTNEAERKSHWLEVAARHLDNIHGLAAKEELTGSLPTLPEAEPACPDQGEKPKVTATELVGLAWLGKVGRDWYAGPEIQRLGDRFGLSAEERLCLALRYGAAELALKLAHELQRKERIFWRGLFPTPRWVPDGGWTVSQALIWGTSRQESRFFPRAESSAKAFGVMQLMPETAKGEARQSQFPEATRMRLQIPAYNLALGQAYMRRMLRQFNGDVVLALSGYNAGPGRARQWQEERARLDPMTFIEGIPITETRTYVKRVLTGMAVYQLLSGGSASIKADMAVGGPGETVLAPAGGEGALLAPRLAPAGGEGR